MLTLTEQKKLLRNKIKILVANLSKKYCEQTDYTIFKYVTGLSEYVKAHTVFCYVGTSNEIDTVPILKDALKRGKRVGVPKCVSKGVMKVYQIQTLGDLKAGSYGILEPPQEAVLIQPNEIHLGIIPCLSCDWYGKRLGYGGGYYDRYLEHANFLKVILCREQVMQKDIPADVFDQVMDIVISEKGIKRVEKGFLNQ